MREGRKERVLLLFSSGTGTGKTLSFVLPLVEQMLSQGRKREGRGRPPVVLVMAPTRELANQVTEVFQELAQGLSVFCIYGGVPYEPQGEEEEVEEWCVDYTSDCPFQSLPCRVAWIYSLGHQVASGITCSVGT